MLKMTINMYYMGIYILYVVYSYILQRQVIMSYINYIILHYIHYVIFTMFIMFFV